MEKINFGIDLGTTNSGIGHYQEGKVNILKNPVGFSETLASVVAFRNKRIFIGQKAKEILMSDPQNVFSTFKRKMGTNENYWLEDENRHISPVELSALVLRELKLFSLNNAVNSAVITIPASFDTIQSNATKDAGVQADIEQVVLLQEPIAACLAYSNENNLVITDEKTWLVYDFGGGTFDAALVKINDRDLKVIDHEGNNFLGGLDIDLNILKKLVIPRIEVELSVGKIWDKINDKNEAVYARLGKYLIYKCEEFKKEISLKPAAWIEINFDDLGLNFEFEIARSSFDIVVKPFYDQSLVIIKNLLKANQTATAAIDRIILVGGTTYIPFIRESLATDTGILIDTSIDPITAIIKGASYYAGAKERENISDTLTEHAEKQKELFDISYENATQDLEELIMVKNTGFNGFLRIRRIDGGFDTGLTKFSNIGQAFVDILPKSLNQFNISIFDDNQNLVFENDSVQITHGQYQVIGQPLPHDICIEVDADDETYLELVFKKNDILPLKKTVYKTFSRSILKGSSDKIVLNIVEGAIGTLPGANLNIGYLEITGTEIEDDIIKGTDIELTFSISESRDLAVNVFISGIDFEVDKSFKPGSRAIISDEKTITEISRGLQTITSKIKVYEGTDEYEKLAIFTKLKQDLESISVQIKQKNTENLTDAKYQIQDKKRALLQQIDKLDYIDNLTELMDEYQENRLYLETKIDEMPPTLKKQFKDIVKEESDFMQSKDKYIIKRKIEALQKINNTLYFQKDESYLSIYAFIRTLNQSEFTDYKIVEKLFIQGDKAFEDNDYPKIKAISNMVYGYLKDKGKKEKFEDGTGLK